MYRIVNYEASYEADWDDFVMTKSVNGTFLQTRRFLNYHPEGRFEDASFLVFDNKEHLVCVCPACTQQEETRIFNSHMGSTFGGLIVCSQIYRAEYMIELVKEIEAYLKEEKYQKVIYKITPDIFSLENSALLEYILFYENYKESKEINLQIEFKDYEEDILSNLSRGKRRNVNNCIKKGILLEPLKEAEQIEEFYQILCESLEKYSLQPVHTVKELIDFKERRLVDECEFFGLFYEGNMIAGTMVFYFRRVSTAHTQYFGALQEYNELSPMSYLYYCMIKEMRERGFAKLSWGITSEHGGKILNFGLTHSKESYGSRHSVNRIFEKVIG